MAQSLGGGCFCGEIRYEVNGEPDLQLMCFCTDCLAIAGTDGFAGYFVKDTNFKVISGEPTVHTKTSKEGRSVHRHFCGTCGSNLWGVTEFGLIGVTAGTLDNPDIFKPTKKVFTENAPHWARIPDYLEKMS